MDEIERKKGKTGGEILDEIFGDTLEAQLLFVGSVNCLRHRPFVEIGRLMQREKACILCPSMTDFATGRYLQQVKEAVAEIARERNASSFVIMYGCQWVILSTDEDLLRQELQEETGVKVRFFDASHMECGDCRKEESEK